MKLPLLVRVLSRLVRLAVPSMRSIRMAAFSLLVFGALGVVSGRAVYADAMESGMGLGHQLASLEDLTGGAYLVRINGAEVHWASNTATQSVDEVLDRYERYCRTSPSSLGQAMQDIPETVAGRIPLQKNDPAHAAIVRTNAEGRGLVACFVDPSGQRRGPDGLRRELQALGVTGDLASLGHFRYVFAERRPKGTRVVTLWSDGPLKPGQMFPAVGDAPGSDVEFAVRPPDSRRTLSVSIDGFAAGVRGYETSREPADVLGREDRALRAKGFRVVEKVGAGNGSAAYLRDDGVEVLLSVKRIAGNEERTSVAIVETGAAIRGVKVEKSL